MKKHLNLITDLLIVLVFILSLVAIEYIEHPKSSQDTASYHKEVLIEKENFWGLNL
ncbi:hypothetical protein [Dethiothermospora halolimnae]|uniref:hypothetical protein n=1 Tax=Dethiothermospora halolimnae TaxID=3114390 RepID=UPI003CCBED23